MIFLAVDGILVNAASVSDRGLVGIVTVPCFTKEPPPELELPELPEPPV